MSKIRYYFVGERHDPARWVVIAFTSYDAANSVCELIARQMFDGEEFHQEFNDWYVVTPDGVPVVKNEAGEVVVDPMWLGRPVELARYV